MDSEELGEFFFGQGLDDCAGWLGYVDEDGNTWVPEIAATIDDWTFGSLETIAHYRAKRDLPITDFIEAGPLVAWKFHRDEDGHFIIGSRNQKPEKQPYGVSAYGAEHLVRDWLKYLGFDDAVTTQFRRDEGVDVITEEFDVQVKNWTSDFIPVSAIREIFGVATSRHKKPMFFSHSDYSYDSLDFAEKVAMPLFRFKPEAAEIISCNQFAEAILMRRGSHQIFIRELQGLWIEIIDAEIRTRQFLNVVADGLANSQIDKFEKAASKFRIALDFDKPAFHHEDNECLFQTPEACFQRVFRSFKDLTHMREETGRILEDLVFDVECGVFDIRPRGIY